MNHDLILYQTYSKELKKEFYITTLKDLFKFLKENKTQLNEHPSIEKIEFVLEYKKIKNRNKVKKWMDKNKNTYRARQLYYRAKTYIQNISKKEMLSLIREYNDFQTLDKEKIRILE